MKILALELSSARGSLAVVSNGNVEVVRDWENDRKNSGPFFESLVEVQKQFGEPDTIIVGVGPGSYAGTRIAISAAIGLQTASQARLVGFPSICAMECDESEFCVIGDARRQTFFFARIRENNLAEGPMLMSEAELREKMDKLDRKMSIFGNAATRLKISTASSSTAPIRPIPVSTLKLIDIFPIRSKASAS